MSELKQGFGWAVKWTYPGESRPFLIGRYWDLSFDPSSTEIPDNLSGYPKAVFRTREMARRVARRASYGKGQVVKVKVTVKEVRP